MKKPVTMMLAFLIFAFAPLLTWAQTPIVEWDFLSGGDGVRWKAIINQFNNSQKDYVLQGTTLTWGDPFYTKVHTAVVAGETPDVMTYHLSHFPAGIQAGDLRPLPQSELQSAGLAYKDFNPVLVDTSMAISKAYGTEGVLYGVPLDTHTSILYFNKNVLAKAGLLGSNGRPLASAFTGIDNFTRSLERIKARTGVLPMAMSSANDPASVWRMWATLFYQQGGSLASGGKVTLDQVDTLGTNALQVMTDWTNKGLVPANVDYAGGVALFSSGKAAFMFNGNWEVPTMVDLEKEHKLPFRFGVMAFPKLYENQETWADSHNLCIPNNTKSPISNDMVHAVMTFISFVEHHAAEWASGGHLPAYLPVLDGPVMKTLYPVDQYAAQAARDVHLEPVNPIFGVGAPTYDAVGNFLSPALIGNLTVADAIAKFKAQLQSLSM